MTTKSIQQKAEDYARSVAMTATDAENIAKDYTAGATNERRELGKVILEMAEAREKIIGKSVSFRAWDILDVPFNKHAELIARLREELK